MGKYILQFVNTHIFLNILTDSNILNSIGIIINISDSYFYYDLFVVRSIYPFLKILIL